MYFFIINHKIFIKFLIMLYYKYFVIFKND